MLGLPSTPSSSQAQRYVAFDKMQMPRDFQHDSVHVWDQMHPALDVLCSGCSSMWTSRYPAAPLWAEPLLVIAAPPEGCNGITTSQHPLTRLRLSTLLLSACSNRLMQIAAQLEQVLLQPGPSESKLAVAQLSAAALLAVQPNEFSYSSLGMRLLRALARAPLRHFTARTMRLSQFCWCWVSVGWVAFGVYIPELSSLGCCAVVVVSCIRVIVAGLSATRNVTIITRFSFCYEGL